MGAEAAPPWPIVARDQELRRALASLDHPEFRGVAFVGDSGVGKSTLARTLASSLEADGRTVRFVLGSETGREVPLGAFSRSISIAAEHEPAAMLAAAYQTLAAEENLVLVVDDAQLLDALSATLIHQVAVGGDARLIVTIRSGEPLPDVVTTLMKERLLLNVHVDAFTREQAGELVRRVLGGSVERRLINELHHRCGGNLLYLRGLLRAGRENGVLVHTDAGWRLQGSLQPDRELLGLAEFRLRSLSRDQREVIEVLAVGELLDWRVLRELCDPDAVSRLERRGLVHLVADGSGAVAQLNHPIFGEAALHLAGVVRTRQLNGMLAQALQKDLEAGGGRLRLPDVRGQIRMAQFMVHSDLEPDLDLIIAAAGAATTMASLDHAEDLARFAFERGGGATAALALAKTLSWQGRGSDAEEVFESCDLHGVDGMLRVRCDGLRATNLFFSCGDVEAGRQVLADAQNRVGSEPGAAVLKAVQVAFAFFCGDVATAVETGPALCTPDVAPLAATWAALSTAHALAKVGRYDGLRRIAEVGLRAAVVSASGPLRFGIGVAEVMAATASGEFPEAERVVERYAALAGGVPEADAMVAALTGMLHLSRGELQSACSSFGDALPELSRGYPSAWLMLTAAWLAMAEAGRGDTAAAGAAVQMSEAAYGPQTAVFLPELELARAWERAAGGEVSASRAHALRAAKIAHEAGMSAVEMLALHAVVRFGDRAHADRLAEVTTTLDTPLAQVIAAHSRGLADNDGDQLDKVADRFADMGALALAADAAAQAAVEHLRNGLRGKGLASSTRAQWLADKGDIRTPAVVAAAQPLPITDREREIANLVAAGLTNREIADRLSVSVRTVDGHLYRIFGKLGIERRDQLAEFFEDTHSGA